MGILNLDGAPVDRVLLEGMTLSLAFRGPDAQEVWCQGPVGLGHALLQIASGTPLEKQPAQIDGRLWIVADARIDARAELIGKLKEKCQTSRALTLSTPDAELILHAYDAWGDACVEHLIGDFSFAIWDARERRLFCARDQFGVKPFFYAHVGSCLIFSNTLDCVRITSRRFPIGSTIWPSLIFSCSNMNQDTLRRHRLPISSGCLRRIP